MNEWISYWIICTPRFVTRHKYCYHSVLLLLFRAKTRFTYKMGRVMCVYKMSSLTINTPISQLIRNLVASNVIGGSMAYAVRRSPPTAGVPSSRLDHSMGSLGGFSSGFLLFSPATNCIPQFSYPLFIHFVSLHFILLCDGALGGSVGILAIHRPSIKGLHRISSLV